MAFVEPVAVGEEMPDVRLFLTSEHYVNLPLALTDDATYRQSLPERWRAVLEDRAEG